MTHRLLLLSIHSPSSHSSSPSSTNILHHSSAPSSTPPLSANSQHKRLPLAHHRHNYPFSATEPKKKNIILCLTPIASCHTSSFVSALHPPQAAYLRAALVVRYSLFIFPFFHLLSLLTFSFSLFLSLHTLSLPLPFFFFEPSLLGPFHLSPELPQPPAEKLPWTLPSPSCLNHLILLLSLSFVFFLFPFTHSLYLSFLYLLVPQTTEPSPPNCRRSSRTGPPSSFPCSPLLLPLLLSFLLVFCW